MPARCRRYRPRRWRSQARHRCRRARHRRRALRRLRWLQPRRRRPRRFRPRCCRPARLRWVRATEPGVFPTPRGLKLLSWYPLALDWVTRVERVALATGKKTSAEVLGRNKLRIAEDGSPLILPAGGTTDRGGAFVAAPRLFRFTRDPAASQVVLGGKLVLRTPGDARVLGERGTAQQVILVVAASRKGEPDQVHILRAPRPG